MRKGIPNHYAKVAIKGALAQGHDETALLQRAGIQADSLNDPAGTITHEQMSVLYKAIWSLLRDEFFGLASTPCKLGFFRLLASHHPRLDDLKSVLDYCSVFFSTTRDDVRFAIETNHSKSEGNLATLIMTINCQTTDTDHFVQEYNLIGWQRYLSWLIGQRIEPSITAFNFAPTPHRDLYRNFFDGEYRFNQPTTHIVFDAKYLDYPIIRTQIELQSYLNSLPLPVFFRPSAKSKLTTQVVDALRNHPDNDLPTLDQIARALGFQKRTLHRKLINENTSFRQIVNEYRMNLAMDWLTKLQLPVNEVSQRLGFSEPAAFCHFFKRQAGLSPSQYTQFNERVVLKLE